MEKETESKIEPNDFESSSFNEEPLKIISLLAGGIWVIYILYKFIFAMIDGDIEFNLKIWEYLGLVFILYGVYDYGFKRKLIVKNTQFHQKFNKVLFGMGIVIVVSILSSYFLVLRLFPSEVMGNEGNIVLSILSAIIFTLVYIILNEKTNHHHVLNFLIASISNILILVFSFLQIKSLDDGVDISRRSHAGAALVLIGIVAFSFIGFFGYYLAKNLKEIHTHHQYKFRMYAVSVLFIFMIVGAGSILYQLYGARYPQATILGGIEHDDGPWLTWEDDPTNSMVVSWFSKERSISEINYGTTYNNLNQIGTNNDEVENSEGYGNDDGVFLHHIYLTDLEPDTKYYYTIPGWTSEQEHNTSIFEFKTAPSIERPFKFVVFGDTQPNFDEPILMEGNDYMAKVLGNLTDIEFTLHVGDLIESGNDHEDWHAKMMSLPLHASNTTYMGNIGNHDFDGLVGASNWGEAFPYPYENENAGKYYSFDYLNARFIMIDNFEHTYHITTPQLKWIENEIIDAQSKDMWVFASFHLSIFSTGSANMDVNVQKQLAPLFAEYGIDGAFYGHDHMYEHYEYTYGNNDLVHSPKHNMDYETVHYWETGGGGAKLESQYGLAEPRDYDYSREWYDRSKGEWVDVEYHRGSWNTSRYITYADEAWTPAGNDTNYYHDSSVECYQEEALQYGHDYGENTLHYMMIQIDGNTCNISAMYPDGTILRGPTGNNAQTWLFTK